MPDDYPGARAHQRQIVGLLLALVVLYIVGGAAWPAAAPWLHVAVSVAATVAGVVALRLKSFGPDRRSWTAVVIGIGVVTLGDALVTSAEQLTEAAGRSAWVEVAHVPGLLCMAIGIFGLGTSRRGHRDGDLLVDIVAAATAMFILAWQPFLGAALADAATPLAVALMTGDGAVRLLVLTVAVHLFGRSVTRNPATRLLCLGAVCAFSSSALDTLSVGDWTSPALRVAVGTLGLLWPVCFVAATLDASTGRLGARFAMVADRITRGRVALSALALLSVPLAVAWTIALGGTPNHALLLPASLVAVGATLWRLLGLAQRGDRQARGALAEKEAYFQDLFAHGSDAIIVADRTGLIINAMSSVYDLIGLDSHEIIGRNTISFIHPEDVDLSRVALRRVLTDVEQVTVDEMRVQHADGAEMWLSVKLTNRLEDSPIGGVVIAFHDITANKRSELELAHRALHDNLTGLANRALFTDRLAHSLLRRDIRQAVMYVDLDHFKVVNDSLGHAAGDRLLEAVSERLAAAVRHGDTVARLGGDEFGILIEASAEEAHFVATVTELAGRILASIGRAVNVGNRNEDSLNGDRAFDAVDEPAASVVVPGASIGVAFAEAGEAAQVILRHADVALYAAKAEGRNRVAVFDAAMQSAASLRAQLENDLRSALRAEQLTVHYQPIVALQSGDLLGFEALARWQHAVLGSVGPDVFIPVAEESGLIGALGAWVLTEACRTAVAGNALRPAAAPVTMSVNVSAGQLADARFPATVREALNRSGLAPSLLSLEVTESALLQDPDAAAVRLRQLTEMGVRVTIDDFGTGHSSLAYLQRFPIDTLKIDESFLEPPDGDQLPAIARGLLELSATMGLTAIAEGIETEAQVDRLVRGGCAYGQGHLFSWPLHATDAVAYAETAGVTGWGHLGGHRAA